MITVYLFAGSLVDLDHIIRASPSLSDIAMFNLVNDLVSVIEAISFSFFLLCILIHIINFITFSVKALAFFNSLMV